MDDIFFYDIVTGILSLLLFIINSYNWKKQLDTSPALFKLYNKVITLSSFFILLSTTRSIYFSNYTLYIYHYSVDLSSIIFLLGMIKNNQIILDILQSVELNNPDRFYNYYYLFMKYIHYFLYFMQVTCSLIVIIVKTVLNNVKYASFIGFNNCFIILIILICLNLSIIRINNLYYETASVFINNRTNPLKKFKYYRYGYNFTGILTFILLFYSSFVNFKINISVLDYSQKIGFSPLLILIGCLVANFVVYLYDICCINNREINDVKVRSNRIFTFQSSQVDNVNV